MTAITIELDEVTIARIQDDPDGMERVKSLITHEFSAQTNATVDTETTIEFEEVSDAEAAEIATICCERIAEINRGEYVTLKQWRQQRLAERVK
jgi:predicted transcriptional regulator